ncbi:MAG: hypothetical protein LQ337_002588 [Flavoplaca oasis]|nr:MAG: hypothetical protein LQ337_002588 [Flavoplaca oasis]
METDRRGNGKTNHQRDHVKRPTSILAVPRLHADLGSVLQSRYGECDGVSESDGAEPDIRGSSSYSLQGLYSEAARVLKVPKGAYFDYISTIGGIGVFQGPDPFAVVGVYVGEGLAPHGFQFHLLLNCMQHALELDGVAPTEDPFVPTWSQLEEAVAKLTVSRFILHRLRQYWTGMGSVQVWNPHAAPGSDEAKQPADEEDVTCKWSTVRVL